MDRASSIAKPGQRTAFVTGATGFVGTNLVAELVSRGWHVTALHRSRSRIEQLHGAGVRLVEGEVTDLESLLRAMPDEPDAVFHVAGSTTFWPPRHAEQRRINVDGTRNVVTAALERRARRLVHTSSIAAYGLHDVLITEETPSTAADSGINYFRTKWLGELEVRRGLEAGLDAVILNPANILGPHDRTNYSRLFALVEAGELRALFPGRACWSDVGEVVRAHVTAAERGRTGHNYLLGGAVASPAEVIRLIGELTGCPVPRFVAPRLVIRAAAAVNLLWSYVVNEEPPITPEGAKLLYAHLVCDSSKAERELGFRTVPLRPMLEASHRWLCAEGLLQGARSAAAGPAPT